MNSKISRNTSTNSLPALISVLSVLLGGGSLILFLIFIYSGSPQFIDFKLNNSYILVFDVFLSLIFFFQHSLMLRKFFKTSILRFFPDFYHTAIFSIASGTTLLTVTLFWQKTDITLYNITGLSSIPCHALFFLSFAGLIWGGFSLGLFDPFGRKEIKNHLKKKAAKPLSFKINGPYQWVRHPLYFFVLTMIWSTPHLSADRLLFNIIWTVWILIGTILEERDLISEFGSVYKRYQKVVPMLLPYRLNAVKNKTFTGEEE